MIRTKKKALQEDEIELEQLYKRENDLEQPRRLDESEKSEEVKIENDSNSSNPSIQEKSERNQEKFKGEYCLWITYLHILAMYVANGKIYFELTKIEVWYSIFLMPTVVFTVYRHL